MLLREKEIMLQARNGNQNKDLIQQCKELKRVKKENIMNPFVCYRRPSVGGGWD